MENNNKKTKIIVITTGGTIEKTYDEIEGSLDNRESHFRDTMLRHLRLPYTDIEVYSILAKDSLQMNEDDRELLAHTIKHHLGKGSPVVVLHGTDTMSVSAEYCLKEIKTVNVPIVFTGAMKPFGFDDSDAKQNVTEALLAAKLLGPGIYISFHNRVFVVPNVRKNKDKRTFEAF